jgi:hypothetical protein
MGKGENLPWKERKPLDEKRSFIAEWERQEESLAELCRRYEISRQTGYKWLEPISTRRRVWVGGTQPGSAQSPASHAAQGKGSIGWSAKSVSQLGPRKLRAYLQRETPKIRWPSRKQHWRPASAGRVGPSTQETKTDASLHRAVETCRSPESGLVRGFQRKVSYPGWLTL